MEKAVKTSKRPVAKAALRRGKTIVEGIDFSRYERPELAESLESVLSVTETVTRFLKVFFLGMLLGAIGMTAVFYNHHWAMILAVVPLALVGSTLIAAILGVTLCGKHILDNVVGILDTSFDISERVLGDVGDIRERGLAITAVAVLGGVNNSVVLPTIEGVVRAKTGFFSRPILWLYRRTFIKVTRIVERRLLEAFSNPGEEEDEAKSGDKSLLDTVEAGAGHLTSLLQKLRQVAISTASKITGAILLPLWILLLLAATAVAGPLALLWYFTL